MKPRLLYLTSEWPWPPTHGGLLQTTHLADGLAEWFDVTMLAVDRPAPEHPTWSSTVQRIALRRRSQLTRAIDALRGIAAGRQVLLQRILRAGGASAASAVIAAVRPSAVVLGRPLFDGVLEAASAAGAKVVIEANEDLERVSWSIARHAVAPMARVAALVDGVVVRRQQRRNYVRADAVLVCSELERDILSSYVDRARIHVMPNTVAVPDGDPGVPPPARAVGFLGSYRYAPNEAAAVELMRHVMPAVRAAGGPRQLMLIGRGPTQRMLQLAEADREVTVTGEVPQVEVPLREAGLLLVPVRSGAGTRVKILEAAAAGIPVISTSTGIEGLNLRPDRDVLIAETATEFADAVVRLQADPTLRIGLVTSAREVVREHNSPAAARNALVDIVSAIGG